MVFSCRNLEWTAGLLLAWCSTVSAIPLLGGRFETTSDVQNLLNLAVDAANMREADDFQTKQSIYQNGQTGSVLSLQSLSLNAKETMSESPMYNIFRHAFLVLGNANEGETAGSFDGQPIEQYGDTLVNDLFALDVENIETDAALVMNVWMVVVHELFQVMQQCKAADKTKGLESLDRAAALWIGEGQEDGGNDVGHLLYNLAEKAGERFDQDNGETLVNTQIIDLFLLMQTNLLTDNTCNGYVTMRDSVKATIGLMTVPLVQNLIHHTSNLQNDGGAHFVELYALATIPQIAACDPAAYDEELHLDVLREIQASQADESIAAIQKAYSCLGITCAQVGSYLGGAVPACQDDTSVIAAGYTTSRSGAQAKNFLDRDIKEIDIFLRFGAYGAAADWYAYGWNSIDYSLKDLATNQVVPAVTGDSYIDIFRLYYEDAFFADKLLTNMVDLVPPYNSATKEQVRNLITGILKYVVMFMTSATSLQYAVEQCGSNQDTSLDFWDTGALFYVGSMEGSDANGNEFGGEFLYTAAKELCSEFGTCATEGQNGVAAATANQAVMTGLNDAVTAIESGSCDVAKGLLEDQILPAMSIPLIQGTIKYASFNAGLPTGTSDSSLAIGDTFARGILPLVDRSEADSATEILEQMQFQLTTKPVSGGFSVVAGAMRSAVPGMSASCSDVGQFEDEPTDGNLCEGSSGGTPTGSTPTATSGGNSPSQAPAQVPTAPGSPSGLAFGRYIFEDLTVADGDGSFALDVRDMFQSPDIAGASTIYNSGKNAVTRGLSGVTGIVSLSSLSREAARFMAEDPMFNIYRYALYDDEDLDETSGEDFLYADDVIVEALDSANDKKLSAEGAVVMNVWMVITHQLYEALRLCRNQEDAVPMVDSAVALWIGKEQSEGKYENGWMMYSIGQSAAQFFGLEEGEAAVNTELMNLFNEAQAIGKTCSGSEDAALDMYFKVQELVRVLSKPLILSLLFHLVGDSKNMVELYAVSVIPQAEACDAVIGDSLQDVLFAGFSQDALTDDVIQQLAKFLRCQRITSKDLTRGDLVDVKLKDLLGSLSTALDSFLDEEDFMPMAGYSPNTDVSELARLDLDVLEMEIMMTTQAYKAADDIYKLGHNGYDVENESRFFSLKSLSTSNERQGVEMFNTFKEYYSNDLYADDIMTDAIENSGDFVDATRLELAEITTRTAQTIVTFLAIVEKATLSEDECNANRKEVSMQQWDAAVALFVGSMEGLMAGGSTGGEGSSMYSLGNEVCDDFGECEASGEAHANQKIMFHFTAGRDAAAQMQCDHLGRVKKHEIIPRLTLLLVQGTMSFALKNMDLVSRDARSLATAHVLAESVLPYVDDVNSTSAVSIENALGDFTTIATGQPVDQILQAFAYALRGMGIDCNDIGAPINYPNLSLCLGTSAGENDDNAGNVPDQAPVADTPTDLGDGLYVTTTYVQDRANIAQDVADLNEAVGSNSYNLAELIYRDGKNSQVYDENGKFVSLRSLKTFSTEETMEMLDEPLFNIYMYALQNDDGTFMSRDVRLYADSLVDDAFSKVTSETQTLPVEAAVALNLWMHIAHVLYKTLKDCKDRQIRDDDGVHSTDIAVAYWIGDGQIAGNGAAGHLLYALAERMGELFNMDDGGQSRTNTNILKLFNEAKHEISLPGACSEGPSSYLRLSRIVNKITSLMAVPLIQSLIHSLRADDRDRVKLYAHAVIPLTAGCNPAAFAYLKKKLLNMQYNIIEVEDIVTSIRSILPCLGLSCSDIGVHDTEMTDEAIICQDPDVFTTMAGFKPASDVREFARLDLDMRQLDILLEMKAYDAAENLYTHGKHVKGPGGGSMSLFHLATTTERAIVPEYDSFLRYYESRYPDPSTYADQIIRSALTNADNNWTDEQRRVIVLKSAQVMVMYFAALQALYEGVSDCQSTASFRASGSSDSWDRGAAMLIGSLEGTQTNGTQDGYMYYDLAQEYCLDFGTCLADSTGVGVNDQLVSLLYTGRGAALGNSCSGLRKAADEISTLILVPVIQGALMSSIGLSKSDNADADLERAKGYVYSRAVLPLVGGASRGAAKTIEMELGFPGPSSTRNTASEVFSSFAQVYPQMNVDCELIGVAFGNDACSGVVYDEEKNNTIWIIVGSLLGICVLCSCGYAIRRRKTMSKLPENNPRFVTTENGELNHSMDLLEKAFSSTPRSITPQSAETVALAEDMYNDASPGDEQDFEEATALKSQMESRDIDII